MPPNYGVPTDVTTIASCGKGRLFHARGGTAPLPILRIAGTLEDMGYQRGYLTGDAIAANARLLPGMFRATPELAHAILDFAWSRLEPFVPAWFFAEAEAIAAGSRAAGHELSPRDLYRLTAGTNLDLYRRDERFAEWLGMDAADVPTPAAMSCTMYAIWGSRTVDGQMLSLRNLDWISQTGADKHRMLCIYQPDDGIAYATVGYAGIQGALAGMSERGITLSEVGAFSAAEELDGVPWTLMAREVLAKSESLDDAIAHVESATHTLGYNYLFADGDPQGFGTPSYTPRAVAFETNHAACERFGENALEEQNAVWTDGDGVEHSFGVPMTEAICRADTAFGRTTRSLQTADNGPGEPSNNGDPGVDGSTYVECHLPMRDMIEAYAKGSAYTFPLRNQKVLDAGEPRKIGPEEALTIAATVAHNTEKLHMDDWNVMSIVYAPSTLDFWVSFETCHDSGAWTNAPDSGYVQINLRDLLDQTGE